MTKVYIQCPCGSKEFEEVRNAMLDSAKCAKCKNWISAEDIMLVKEETANG